MLSGTGAPLPGEKCIVPTWGRIGHHPKRCSGWCGPCLAPPDTPPCTIPGDARCNLRQQAGQWRPEAQPGQKLLCFHPKHNLFLSEQKKKACFPVRLPAPGRCAPCRPRREPRRLRAQRGPSWAGASPPRDPPPSRHPEPCQPRETGAREPHAGSRAARPSGEGSVLGWGSVLPTKAHSATPTCPDTPAPGGPARRADTPRGLGTEHPGTTGPWGVSWGVGRIQGLRAGRGHRRGRGLGWRRRWGSHRGDGDAGGGLRAVGMPSGSREDEDTSFSWRALQEDVFGGQTFVDSRPAGP